MTTRPLGDGGRGANGRFQRGWKGGPGNPFGRESERFRSELWAASTPERRAALIDLLWSRALTGDRWAVEALLDRLLGKPTIFVAGSSDDEGDDSEARLKAAAVLLDSLGLTHALPASMRTVVEQSLPAPGAVRSPPNPPREVS